jgi:uncharacterized protein
MNDTIIKFIDKQTVATICCIDERGEAYCFSCFYAFNHNDGLLYFKSSSNAHHSSLLEKKGTLAGTILPDRLRHLVVQGVQFQGSILDPNDPLCSHASMYYLKKFPFAMAIPGQIYILKLSNIKMTDSSKGFGKKILWQREETTIPA